MKKIRRRVIVNCNIINPYPNKRCGAIIGTYWAKFMGSTIRYGKFFWVFKLNKTVKCKACGRKTRIVYVWPEQ